jgi:phosphopantetheinyl transferase (holo-ACP synthase)
MGWKDIEIAWPARAPAPTITPEVILRGETAAVAAAMGVTRVHLTVTVSKALAAAWVVLEGLPAAPDVKEA